MTHGRNRTARSHAGQRRAPHTDGRNIWQWPRVSFSPSTAGAPNQRSYQLGERVEVCVDLPGWMPTRGSAGGTPPPDHPRGSNGSRAAARPGANAHPEHGDQSRTFLPGADAQSSDRLPRVQTQYANGLLWIRLPLKQPHEGNSVSDPADKSERDRGPAAPAEPFRGPKAPEPPNRRNHRNPPSLQRRRKRRSRRTRGSPPKPVRSASAAEAWRSASAAEAWRCTSAASPPLGR